MIIKSISKWYKHLKGSILLFKGKPYFIFLYESDAPPEWYLNTSKIENSS